MRSEFSRPRFLIAHTVWQANSSKLTSRQWLLILNNWNDLRRWSRHESTLQFYHSALKAPKMLELPRTSISGSMSSVSPLLLRVIRLVWPTV
jgi:hypothetical protein